MTTTTTTTQTKTITHHHPPPVIFSFAAYSKSIINHLRSHNIPIGPGLTEPEFIALESTHNFQFPPDLRSILREGLPLGPHFPDWRSPSPHLLSLPISSLLRQISADFWPAPWGPRPASKAQSVSKARLILSRAAQLIPVYRQFYIAATPNLAGNPVFYVCGRDVRCCGFDLAGFFRREGIGLSAAWAAKRPRRIEVWSELADGEGWVEEMGRRLREGGWGEEEVMEMMMADRTVEIDGGKSLLLHVRGLARVMIDAGWSEEDVLDALGGGSTEECHVDTHPTLD